MKSPLKKKYTGKEVESDSDATIITGTQEYVHKKQKQVHRDVEDIQEASDEPSQSLLKRKKKKKKSLELSRNEISEGHFEEAPQSNSMLNGLNRDSFEFTTDESSSSFTKVKKRKKKKKSLSQAPETELETESQSVLNCTKDDMDAFMTDDSSVNSDKVKKRKKKKSISSQESIPEIGEPPVKKKKNDSVDLFTQDIFKQPSFEDFVNSTPKKKKKKYKELSLNGGDISEMVSSQEVELDSSMDSQNGVTVLKKKKKKKDKLNPSQNDDRVLDKSEDNSSVSDFSEDSKKYDGSEMDLQFTSHKNKSKKSQLMNSDESFISQEPEWDLSHMPLEIGDVSNERVNDPANEKNNPESSEYVIGKKKKKKKSKGDHLSQTVIDLDEQDSTLKDGSSSEVDNNSGKNMSDFNRVKEKSSKEKNSEGDILLDPGKIKREKDVGEVGDNSFSSLNVELNDNSQLKNGSSDNLNRVNNIADDTDSEIDIKEGKKKKKHEKMANATSSSLTSNFNNDGQRLTDFIGVKEKKSKKNSIDGMEDDISLDSSRIKGKKGINDTNLDTLVEEGNNSTSPTTSNTVKRKMNGKKKESSKNTKWVSASNLLDQYLEKVDLNEDTRLTSRGSSQEIIHDSSGFSSAVSEIQENESKEAPLKPRRNKRHLHEIIDDIIKDLESNDDNESTSVKKKSLDKNKNSSSVSEKDETNPKVAKKKSKDKLNNSKKNNCSSMELLSSDLSSDDVKKEDNSDAPLSSKSSIHKNEKEETNPKVYKKKSKDKILGLSKNDKSVNDRKNNSNNNNISNSMELSSSDLSSDDVKKEDNSDAPLYSKSVEDKTPEKILKVPGKKPKDRIKVNIRNLVPESQRTRIKKWRKENSSSPSLGFGDIEVKEEIICHSPLSIKSDLSYSDTEVKLKDTSNNSSGHSNGNDAYFVESDSSDTEIDDKVDKLDVMRTVLKNILILVDFEVPRLHQICNRASQPTRTQRIQCAEENISIKNGKFVKGEDEQIIANYKEFIKIHNLEDMPELFTSLDKKYIPAKEKQNFLFFLAKDLPDRTPFSVYQRFKILLVHVKKGRFTEEEDEYIIKKMEETECHRNFAVEIADHLKRPLEAIQKRISRLKDCHTRKIRWRKGNLAAFIRYLLKVTKTSEENIEQLKNRHITCDEWTRLSKKLDKVPVRILKRAWLVKIHPALFIPGVSFDLRQVKLKLIELFYKNNEHDWRSLNWKKYLTHFDGLTCLRIYTIFKTWVNSRIPPMHRKNLRKCVKILRKIPPTDLSSHVIYKIQYKNGEIIELGSKTKKEKS